jgi:peptide subunit release factor 1 (eRF1)
MDLIPIIDQQVSNTSCITIISPAGPVAKLQQFITKELATASNIKNRLNRHSVISALNSIANGIPAKIPATGIAIFAHQSI